MQLINTPVGLSVIDDFILRNIPEGVQSGIVVNAGDGRLGKEINKRYGDKIDIYNVEPREKVFQYLEGSKEKNSREPWDVEWYLKIAKKHKGGVDFICFINIHEYWEGNLYKLKEILNCLKADGIGFISFYNKNSLYEMRQSIPPFVAGFEQLASPIARWAKGDLISWIIYLLDIGMVVDQIWGMLEGRAFKYCQENVKETMVWKEGELTVNVGDAGEAFIYGAPVMCMKFKNIKEGDTLNPKFFGIKYNASILQAILFPYLEVIPNELNLFKASLEKENQLENESEEYVLLKFLVSQLEDFGDIRTVLVVGCNWGMDLLALQKIKPSWKITGVDASAEIAAIGEDVLKSHGIKITHYDVDGKLPFGDNSFDLVISLKHFSIIYYSLAKILAKEMLRVSKKGIVQFEDLRGPEFSMQLKLYSIPDIYKELSLKPDVRFLRIKGEDTEFYIVKVKK